MNKPSRAAALVAAFGSALSACAGNTYHGPVAATPTPVAAAPAVSPSFQWYVQPTGVPAAAAVSQDLRAQNYWSGMVAKAPTPPVSLNHDVVPTQATRGMTAGQAALSMWRPCRSILC